MINNLTAQSSSSSLSPPWIELPTELTANILHRLDPDEILDRAERVCSTWRRLSGSPSFWRVFHMKCPDNLIECFRADTVFRRVVDRSQGKLIDVNIRCFGTDDLLRYISDRLSHLKILSLQICHGIYGMNRISSRGLTSAVENFPHLEELHLFHITSICAIDIETIGVSCPMLKSFTFYNCNVQLLVARTSRKLDLNSDALSIAKKMPNLVRLCLFGNLLRNEGLVAILDGCPNLESLDLRGCFGVDIQGDLERRCSDQIKEFHPPLEDGWDDQIYDPVDEDAFYDE